MSAESPPGERPDPVTALRDLLRSAIHEAGLSNLAADTAADAAVKALTAAATHPVTEDAGVELAPGGVAVTGVSPPPERWCAKHRDGWCAVDPDVEPEEGTDGVDTECGYVITLPGGFDHRAPDCPDCIAGLAGADTKEAED